MAQPLSLYPITIPFYNIMILKNKWVIVNQVEGAHDVF